MPLPSVGKVICFVVRRGELLVFRHRDHPDAGVQVPAGAVGGGEAPAAAEVREAEEETGFAEPQSGGFWFEFFWVPLVPELRLAGDQHALLSRIGASSTTPQG